MKDIIKHYFHQIICAYILIYYKT